MQYEKWGCEVQFLKSYFDQYFCCLVSWVSCSYLFTFQILIVLASILWTHSGENSDNRQNKFNQNLATWKWLIYTYRLKAYIFNSLHTKKDFLTVIMGAGASKERLSKADMEFLLLHTHYDEKTIQGINFENLTFILLFVVLWRQLHY